MAKAIERASAEDRPVAQVLAEVAREAGEEIGANAPSLAQALTDHGYRPEERENGSLGLLDAPSTGSPGVPGNRLSMNLELLSAVVDGTKAPYRACFESPTRDGHCCVRLDPESPAHRPEQRRPGGSGPCGCRTLGLGGCDTRVTREQFLVCQSGPW